MNDTPSPAPQRRRRRPIDPDAVQPSEPVGELTRENARPQAAPQRTRPSAAPQFERARSSDPREEIVRRRRQGEMAPRPVSRKKTKRTHGPLASLPAPLRIAIFAVLIIAFFVCAVFITKSYLAAMEERRRLEAEAAERAQHPLYYADIIVPYAQAQGLDPALVCAVVLCESSFDPHAESHLGARGLMQLMPDTAQWVAEKLDEDGSYTIDSLYDPETNIRYGTWYLGYLSRRFGGDATKIVCAYHAGQGNVDSWLSNPKYSADGVTLTTIPTQDTATYAARVLRARDVYRKHYFPVATPEPSASPAP